MSSHNSKITRLIGLLSGVSLLSAAVNSSVLGSANRGLDIERDLVGDAHCAGLVRRDTDGSYYMETVDGQSMLWSDSMLWADALTEPVAINTWVPQE